MKARLRLLQLEGDLVVAVDHHLVEIVVPDLARVLAELVLPDLAGQHVESALHVIGRERLAVVPLDALVELEGELGPGPVPRPALGQVGHDRLKAVVTFGRIEHHKVVVEPHERQVDRDRRSPRGARRSADCRDGRRAASRPASAPRRAQRRCRARRQARRQRPRSVRPCALPGDARRSPRAKHLGWRDTITGEPKINEGRRGDIPPDERT